MQHKSRLVVAIVLLFALVNPAQAATPKAGAKCAKVGTTATASGKKFTCIKSGTKLVWNKGVAIKAVPKPSPNPVFKPVQPTPTPAPTQDPSPTPTPTPTIKVKSFSERWNETESKAGNTLKIWNKDLATGSPKTKIEYWFGPKISQNVQTEAQRRMDNAVLQWERYMSVTRTKVFFDLGLYTEMQAICERISARSPKRNFSGCMNQFENSYSRILYHASSWESEGGYLPIIDPNLSKDALVNHNYGLEDEAIFYSSSFLPRIEHEWFHQVQFDLTGNNYVREYSCWFLEGSSEYFGTLAAIGDNSDKFLQHRAQSWLGYDNNFSKDSIRKWVEQASIPKLAYGDNFDRCSTLARPETIYSYGAILTEWMVAKIGIPKVLAILKDTESMGWDMAFTKSVGGSPKSLLDEMSEYLYSELAIMRENSSWAFLPQCRTYRQYNPGICFSGNIGRGQ